MDWTDRVLELRISCEYHPAGFCLKRPKLAPSVSNPGNYWIPEKARARPILKYFAVRSIAGKGQDVHDGGVSVPKVFTGAHSKELRTFRTLCLSCLCDLLSIEGDSCFKV
jgi:hypothetical protein